MNNYFEIRDLETDIGSLKKSIAAWVGKTAAQDIVYDDLQKKIEDTKKELLKNTYPIAFEVNSQYYKTKLLNIIVLIDNIDKKIINEALTLLKDNLSDSSSSIKMAQYYLLLGEQMKKLFIMIDELANNTKTGTENIVDFDINNIKEFFSIIRQNKRYVFSQDTINNPNMTKSLEKIFQLKNIQGTITLIISNADKAWQDIIQSNQTDEAVNKHYAQFKQYTAEHYFSTSLTGNYLYQILGSINTSKRFRTEFWSWYHKEGGGYDLFHTEENFDNFKNALKSLWGNLAINDEQQGYLNTFLKAAEEGRKIATRGGVNWGHVAEAFERHLEEHHGFGENGLPQKDKYKDFRDYYPNTDEPHLQKDWVQHLLLSQGKLPGYFGPDTEYAQIKQFSTKGGSLNVININQLVHARVYLLKILSLIQKGEDLIKYSQNLQRQYAMDMNAMDQMGKDLETHIIKELQ